MHPTSELPTKKVTATIPTQLLADAQSVTGENITETIIAALATLTRDHAYEGLRHYRGKMPLDIDIRAEREDRDYQALGIE
ncbi:MAG: hypothetical protein AAF846_12730 [Chloroflexota bacterium]